MLSQDLTGTERQQNTANVLDHNKTQQSKNCVNNQWYLMYQKEIAGDYVMPMVSITDLCSCSVIRAKW